MSLTQFNNYSTAFSNFIDINYYQKPYVDSELETIKINLFSIPNNYFDKTYINSNFYNKLYVDTISSNIIDNYYTNVEANNLFHQKSATVTTTNNIEVKNNHYMKVDGTQSIYFLSGGGTTFQERIIM